MGIQGFYNILEKVLRDDPFKRALLIRKVLLKNLKGKTIALDGHGFIHRYSYSHLPYSHLLQIGWLITDLKINGINPVFVFDGKSPKAKNEEKKKREKRRAEQFKNLEKVEQELETKRACYGIKDYVPPGKGGAQLSYPDKNEKDVEEIQRLQQIVSNRKKSILEITPQKIEDVKYLIRLMGVKVIDLVEGEGEAICSILNRLGYVDIVASEDADVFIFQGKYLLRGIGGRENREDNLRLYDISKLIKELNFRSRDEMIDFCILSGCDFCNKIPGIGPVNARKLILKYGNIETILKNLPERFKNNIPDTFNYNEARKIFKDYSERTSLPDDVMEKWSHTPQDYNHEMILYFLADKVPEADDHVRLWTYHITGTLPEANHELMEFHRNTTFISTTSITDPYSINYNKEENSSSNPPSTITSSSFNNNAIINAKHSNKNITLIDTNLDKNSVTTNTNTTITTTVKDITSDSENNNTE